MKFKVPKFKDAFRALAACVFVTVVFQVGFSIRLNVLQIKESFESISVSQAFPRNHGKFSTLEYLAF